MEGHTNTSRIIRQSRKVRLEKILQAAPAPVKPETSSIFDCLFLLAVHVPEAVIVTNRSGEIMWVNIGFTNLCGYTLREVIGKKPGPILQGPRTDPETIIRLRQAIRAGQPWDGEILNYKKDGEGYGASLMIRPVHDQGQLVGFVGVSSELVQ